MGRISDLIEKMITRENRDKYESRFYAESESREGEQAIRERVRNRARVAVLVDAIVEVGKLGTVNVDRRDRIALSGCYERLAKIDSTRSHVDDANRRSQPQ